MAAFHLTGHPASWLLLLLFSWQTKCGNKSPTNTSGPLFSSYLPGHGEVQREAKPIPEDLGQTATKKKKKKKRLLDLPFQYLTLDWKKRVNGEVEQWAVSHTSQAEPARSADSWEPLLISYFCTLKDDWGCYVATLQESGASREGRAPCSHCVTTINYTRATETRLLAKMKSVLSALRLWTVCTYCKCICCHLSTVAQGREETVCKEDWGGMQRSADNLGALLHYS